MRFWNKQAVDFLQKNATFRPLVNLSAAFH